MNHSKLFVRLMVASATLAAVPALPTWAATYPERPVRFLVGFSPGGANDLVARVVGTRLGPRLGQQVVVDNRPGAGGNIAHDMLAKATPDGYTMVLASVSSLAMSPALLGKVPFDPIRDFTPVAQLVDVCSLLATLPSGASKSMKDFIARAKQQPGQLSVANPGIGSIAHLSFELFNNTAGIRVLNVPYKGGAPASIDVLSGQVEHLIGVISTGGRLVQSGRLRGLAVTSLQRSPSLPDVPSLAESGFPGFEANGWLGIAFPAGTPAAIVARMHKEAAATMAMPEVSEPLLNVGLVPVVKNPDAFRRHIRAELSKWTKLVKDAGLQAK